MIFAHLDLAIVVTAIDPPISPEWLSRSRRRRMRLLRVVRGPAVNPTPPVFKDIARKLKPILLGFPVVIEIQKLIGDRFGKPGRLRIRKHDNSQMLRW